MSSTPAKVPPEPSVGHGHLTVRPEGLGPAEVRFSFEHQDKRLGGAIGVSVASHAALVVLGIIIASLLPERTYEAILPERLPQDIVWIAQEGPGGGGGGGGNEMKEPPREAELPGQEKITVPAVKPPAMEVPKEPEPEPEPVPELKIPAQTMADAKLTAPGVIAEGVPESASQGSGTGGGAGEGAGTGVGPGEGPGLGPGSGGGVGGGFYRPGNGVTLPRVLFEKKPAYTADAMRAKVQGTVLLECVVLPDGTVGEVDIVRSLDSTFGLDLEAVKAARQWRFQPGMRFGEPVPVLVTIELQFTLR